ncbi:MAG TPA: hypothetical protein VNT52_11520, partial [Acidimicrobiales bacterium]|nr:hypothetical protein [Acidimicrobiales bacterium]
MSAMLLGRVSPVRRFRNRLAIGMVWLSVATAAVPLAFLMVYLAQKGAGIVDWNFLTDDIPISSRLPGPGMGPAVLGTLLITGMATLVSV